MDVQQQLLAEAQTQIASLRNELFTARRAAEEQRQERDAAVAARQALHATVSELQAKCGALEARAALADQLQATSASLERELNAVGHRLVAATAQVEALQQQLQEERLARRFVEEAKARLETDRSRLQNACDVYAVKAKMALKSAEEAEEEASTLRAELAALQASRDSFYKRLAMFYACWRR